MFVHELEFTNVSRLAGAYELLALDGGVADCSIEIDELRLVFTTHSTQVEQLVERICGSGGLRVARRRPAGGQAVEVV